VIFNDKLRYPVLNPFSQIATIFDQFSFQSKKHCNIVYSLVCTDVDTLYYIASKEYYRAVTNSIGSVIYKQNDQYIHIKGITYRELYPPTYLFGTSFEVHGRPQEYSVMTECGFSSCNYLFTNDISSII